MPQEGEGRHVELTGLRADVPIGFLAAMGVLRMVNRASDPLQPVRMAWKASGGTFHPVLERNNSETAGPEAWREELISDLLDYAGPGWPDAHAFGWGEQIKGTPSDVFADQANHLDEWYAAFGSELIANDKSEVESTPLDMSFAKQKFLADTVKLREELMQPKGRKATYPAASFEEALFGPWTYRDDCHSRGWDPATLKEAAFTYQEPSPMPNAGMRALVWLAVHGLPMFPCFVFRRKLLPRGFTSKPGELRMNWPVWEPFLDSHGIGMLMGQLPRLERLDEGRKELLGRGVLAVYSSRRAKLTKYMVSLLTAEKVL
jgi:hypothetical protein